MKTRIKKKYRTRWEQEVRNPWRIRLIKRANRVARDKSAPSEIRLQAVLLSAMVGLWKRKDDAGLRLNLRVMLKDAEPGSVNSSLAPLLENIL